MGLITKTSIDITLLVIRGLCAWPHKPANTCVACLQSVPRQPLECANAVQRFYCQGRLNKRLATPPY